MNSSKKTSYQSPQSSIKNFFRKLFCINTYPKKKSLNKQNRPKAHSKQTVQLAPLGSYKASSLCKVSRKNFIASQKEIESGKLPNVVTQYLSDKIAPTTAVVKGDISAKITKKIPFTIRLLDEGETTRLNGVFGNIDSIRLRLDQFCIYKPKLETASIHSLLDSEDPLGQQIHQFASKFKNSIFILPIDMILDQIGALLSDIPKLVEIQTVAINGLPYCYMVYVGGEDFILMSDKDQIEYIVKQLQKDLKQENKRLSELVNKIYSRASIKQLLSMLNKSSNEAYLDTVLSCFVKNAELREFISAEEIEQIFPYKEIEAERSTPIFRHTGRFNTIPSMSKITSERSFGLNVVNGVRGSLSGYENSMETFARTESWRADCDLKAGYEPF